MRRHLLAVASSLCLLAVPARSQTGAAAAPAASEEAAILAVIDQFMDAITTNDAALMATIRASEGFVVTARPGPDGAPLVRRRAYDPAAPIAGRNRERYWDPVVHVRGSIAVVWTPYEFEANGRTSHCGIDVFDLFKEQGAWKISHAMWTVEPDACPALRPADASRIRPAR